MEIASIPVGSEGCKSAGGGNEGGFSLSFSVSFSPAGGATAPSFSPLSMTILRAPPLTLLDEVEKEDPPSVVAAGTSWDVNSLLFLDAAGTGPLPV